MDKINLRNKVWKILPEDFRNILREYHKELLDEAEGFFHNSAFLKNKLKKFEDLFGRDNLLKKISQEEYLYVKRFDIIEIFKNEYLSSNRSPYQYNHTMDILNKLYGHKCLNDDKPTKFESGDIIKHIESGSIGVIDKPSAETNYYFIRWNDNNHLQHISGEYLELYNDNNCITELNLSEILKDCENELFYFPTFGYAYLQLIDYDHLEFIPENNALGILSIYPNGQFCTSGIICIYPSEDYYIKYPNEPLKAWNEWLTKNKNI